MGGEKKDYLEKRSVFPPLRTTKGRFMKYGVVYSYPTTPSVGDSSRCEVYEVTVNLILMVMDTS